MIHIQDVKRAPEQNQTGLAIAKFYNAEDGLFSLQDTILLIEQRVLKRIRIGKKIVCCIPESIGFNLFR